MKKDYINLNYISADDLSFLLSYEKLTANDLANWLHDRVNQDLANAQGYIYKYDNEYDALSVDLNELKTEVNNIRTNLEKIRKGELK